MASLVPSLRLDCNWVLVKPTSFCVYNAKSMPFPYNKNLKKKYVVAITFNQNYMALEMFITNDGKKKDLVCLLIFIFI